MSPTHESSKPSPPEPKTVPTRASWPYGPIQECSRVQSPGAPFGSFPIRTRDFGGTRGTAFPAGSPAPAQPQPLPQPQPQLRSTPPAPGNFQIQKYISSPSSRSSKYLPFVDATSPKPRKALHSAVVLRMRPCTKIHVSSSGKNVVKNLSLPYVLNWQNQVYWKLRTIG